MILNTHQSIDEIIRAASPSEKVLWQQVFLFCGERAAVRQLYYQGVIAGSEFLTYNANKLYVCLELDLNNGLNYSNIQPYARFYNNANAISLYGGVKDGVWNATAAAIYSTGNDILKTNLIFSRIEVGVYSDMKFIGYRVNY